ncbi:UNVERIFIED_CONTAM: hypothetical protein Sangu_2826300 [Sesamum angustifolium]|uniref:Uncharacterized protein n=1 Tax=Sesamum angustifolium TaxID=2727405 RepID=A0AAW2IRR6_9LAMI
MSIPKEPEQVIKQRDGSVLGKKTILKSDHFPGCHNKRLVPHIDGAPNYRKANSLPVHGVAIPTIDGIRNVLKHIGAHMNGEQIRVLWINLREEPVNFHFLVAQYKFVLEGCKMFKRLAGVEVGVNPIFQFPYRALT